MVTPETAYRLAVTSFSASWNPSKNKSVVRVAGEVGVVTKEQRELRHGATGAGRGKIATFFAARIAAGLTFCVYSKDRALSLRRGTYNIGSLALGKTQPVARAI